MNHWMQTTKSRSVSIWPQGSKINPETIGREKVIALHLDSQNRALWYSLQEVDHSIYRQINPLHIPNLFSLIGRRHGQGELYAAVSSSIMTLFSTVNRKKCIQQERAYHAAIAAEHITKVEELNAELAAIEAVEGNIGNDEMDNRSNKRRRTWWWGLLGYGSWVWFVIFRHSIFC